MHVSATCICASAAPQSEQQAVPINTAPSEEAEAELASLREDLHKVLAQLEVSQQERELQTADREAAAARCVTFEGQDLSLPAITF